MCCVADDEPIENDYGENDKKIFSGQLEVVEAVNGREAAKFFKKIVRSLILTLRCRVNGLEAKEGPGERQGLRHYFSDCI